MKTRFQVDTRLAKLLSENYRSSEKALKELVDNAWDADAELVMIELPEPLTSEPIIIQDHGSGMTEEELGQEYLFIASDRRQRRGDFTIQKNRKVKGRKGIGKFAGLMAANSMQLETWARGRKTSFTLTNSDCEAAEDLEKLPINIFSKECTEMTHGTRITLTSLNQNLAFPSVDKLRQLLLQDYGREEDFQIKVNGKPLGVDDIQGTYTKHERELPEVGIVKLQFTISNHKRNLRQPGISIRVGGKVVGKPEFFGLDEAEDFPPKLLKKLYGEIEVDGLVDHVTADWGAIIENSKLFQSVCQYVQPLIREKFQEEYGREINLAQARLQKRINERLALLPEYKRQYADKAIKSILGKYFGEPESKVEPIVSVLLDALERSEYRTVLDYIHEASHTDIVKLSEVLAEFGLAEIAIVGEQANSRLEFLNQLEYLCSDPNTKEKLIHESLEKNLWIFGLEYSFFSSNKSLKRQVEDYLGQKCKGKRANKRPDLVLTVNYRQEYLLIEFKRPSHTLRLADYQQATAYRNDFVPFTDAEIKVTIVGGKRGSDLPPLKNREPNTEILVFDEVISNARNQLNWLLLQLGGENHA
jgi:Histidine kinase-, DNA gyrase B-, and HSP90-like ATPase